jgi:hypothetical protein
LIPVPAEISINIGISFADIFVQRSFADIFVQRGGMKMLALMLKN